MSWKVCMFSNGSRASEALETPRETPIRRLFSCCFMSYAKSLFYTKATVSYLCEKSDVYEGDCFILFHILCEKSILYEGDYFILYAKSLFYAKDLALGHI